MNRANTSLRLETLLILAFAALGALLRLSNLGWPPLSDAEAANALKAINGAVSAGGGIAGSTSLEGDSPVYTWTLSVLLSIFGGFEAAPRLIPALAGTALLAAPLFWRGRLGSSRTVVLTLLLAVSPTFIAVGRTAGGSALAICAILLALSVLLGTETGREKTRARLSGAFFGLGLASGAASLVGLTGIGLAGLLSRLRFGSWPGTELARPSARSLREFLVFASVSLFVGATGLGLYLGAFAGSFESLGHWTRGWFVSSGYPALTAAAALLFYEPLITVFGLAGGILAFRERDGMGKLAVAWAAAAMVFVLAYPSRSALDLAWVVFPLALLSTRAMTRSLEFAAQSADRWAMLGLSGVIVLLMSFSYLQLAGIANAVSVTSLDNELRLGLVIASVVLGGVVMILFGLGWSWRAAFSAAGLALIVGLMASTLAAGWRLNHDPAAASAREIWRRQASTVGQAVLLDTLKTLSQSQTGRTDAIQIQTLDPLPPSLQWSLRSFERFDLNQVSSVEAAPVVLALDIGPIDGLRSDYVGQSLVTSERWGWIGAVPGDFIAWLIDRQAPVVPERWLLLVRSDLIGFDELQPIEAEETES